MRTFLVAAATCFPLLLALGACSDNTDPSASASSSSGRSGSSGSSSGDGVDGSSGSSGASSSSGSSSGSGPRSTYPCEPGRSEKPIRIVAGNISNGNAQTYDDGTGLRIFKALTADIALVQEMNYGNDGEEAMRSFVDAGFGAEYSWFRGNGTSIPNGIVSRYPIVDTGQADDPDSSNTRTFVWARIDVPGDHDVLAVSVHLSTDAPKRRPQVETLLGMIDGVVRDGDLLVLGGDFNTDSRDATGVPALAVRFEVNGPYPADGEGNPNTNASRGKPYDWVVADSELEARSIQTTLGERTYEHGLVFDARIDVDRSQVQGVQASDSDGHQHMAVLRTFAVCE